MDNVDIRELIQDDLICILEDLVDDKTLTDVCQVIVDRFKLLEDNK